jgi:Family of unknown function (DUF6876)
MAKEELLINLRHFTGTENYYKHPFGILYTDGVRFLAMEAQCYWLIDLVASYQTDRRVSRAGYQLYELEVNEDKSGSVTIKDLGGKVLAKQWLDYTDFPLEYITLMFENNVLFLLSEY